MNKYLTLIITVLITIVVIFTGFILIPGDDNSNDIYKKTKASYIEYCAGCHGYELEEFVNKSKWLYGTSENDLFRNIKYGQEEIGMPAFEVTFSDEEIKNLTAYILSDGVQDKFLGQLTGEEDENIIKSEKQNFRVDTVISGLDIPWGMTWLPDGDMLITERSGTLFRYLDGRLYNIQDVPGVYAFGQGGLLDIELHPEYINNGWIYISYSYYKGEKIEDGGSTAIMRFRLENDRLVDREILFKAVPAEKRGVHFGSRLEFDSEGYLYFTVGDRGRQENAQILSNHSGCVHRIHDDGRIPADNPFVQTPDAMPTIFNYGHRNIQGLGINPQTNELWSHEHGPKGGDEVNIERKGLNYGWPAITFGINYDGTIITEYTAKAGMEQPVTYWIPSIAPCGMDFIEGNRYKNWKGNLLVGSLRFKYVARCEMENNKIVHQEKLLEGIGRVRNVKLGPDGYIYVSIEQPGKILRIVPVD